ncbi:MAG TPA: SDR family NAD(P)-dependent oxidoreductase [Bacteroidia bacterium]|nr:SDR family NAD(P)-dependent oxidoreductase [Bacteroidia bacterium]
MERTDKGYALITGASRGIGKAFAEELAKRGYNLALVSLAGEDLPELAIELAGKHHVTVRTLETNLAESDAAEVVVDWVMREGMSVTMLINNAGLGSVGPFHETDMRKHQAMLNLNMLTPYYLQRRLMPMLQKQQQAYIINISSQASFYPIPYKGTYSASKAFLTYISLSTEWELRGSNVHVCVVCPSGVKTSPAIRERIETAGPLSRLVALEPEEVVNITLKKAFKKKRFIVPGALNRLSYYATLLTPDFIRMAFIARKMKRNPFDAPEPVPSEKLTIK